MVLGLGEVGSPSSWSLEEAADVGGEDGDAPEEVELGVDGASAASILRAILHKILFRVLKKFALFSLLLGLLFGWTRGAYEQNACLSLFTSKKYVIRREFFPL